MIHYAHRQKVNRRMSSPAIDNSHKTLLLLYFVCAVVRFHVQTSRIRIVNHYRDHVFLSFGVKVVVVRLVLPCDWGYIEKEMHCFKVSTHRRMKAANERAHEGFTFCSDNHRKGIRLSVCLGVHTLEIA